MIVPSRFGKSARSLNSLSGPFIDQSELRLVAFRLPEEQSRQLRRSTP
jgi:hypothetical protein